MEFRIASSFQDSLQKLTNTEQTAVKSSMYDIQANPANPGLQVHRLDKIKDPNFWSARVNQDIRIIYHQKDSSLLVCYVDHHDKAYKWAKNRKFEVHPTTGAAQIVEIRETVKEVVVEVYVHEEMAAPPLFRGISDDELLGYGVPEEWLPDVKAVNDEDSLLQLEGHLPEEAFEALLILFDGGKPKAAEPVAAGTDPFDHPDAQRRFRVMTDIEELKQALEEPWEKWTVFLHPAQRQFVERHFNGPARIAGSAGTGKTVVALHRAVRLARQNPDSRVLLTTFSTTLANLLRTNLRKIIGADPHLAERIEIHPLNAIGKRLYELQIGKPTLATKKAVREALANAAADVEHSFTIKFLVSEWNDVIDAWQIKDWESYRDFARLGRKVRLNEAKRQLLWQIFEMARQSLANQGIVTQAEVFWRLAEKMDTTETRPFDFAVIDEAQDIDPAQLRFLSALAADKPNGLFFAGDLGQRIFQTAFSWKSLGVDVRGRSRTLRVNYRTSHQIRTSADRLLGPEVSDVDGNIDSRRGTISVFEGPPLRIENFDSPEAEIEGVANWIKNVSALGVVPREIGVFVRSENELERATAAVASAGLEYSILDDLVETVPGRVSVGTMHLAKGLEFRAVAVMACDDEVIPSQERIETAADEPELREVYDTERHLLYVACTRARDHLLVTGGNVRSEFLEDLV